MSDYEDPVTEEFGVTGSFTDIGKLNTNVLNLYEICWKPLLTTIKPPLAAHKTSKILSWLMPIKTASSKKQEPFNPGHF